MFTTILKSDFPVGTPVYYKEGPSKGELAGEIIGWDEFHETIIVKLENPTTDGATAVILHSVHLTL